MAACRNEAIDTLSPFLSLPTRFMPSFQSPLPNSGRPWSLWTRLTSMARAQCSNRVPLWVLAVGVKKLSIWPSVSLAPQERRCPRRAREIGSYRDVVCGGIGQLQAIVDDARTYAAPRRQPPVLHVAFGKLARRSAQDVLAGQIWSRQAECHHVLQLVTEAECAARLVEGGARRHTAGKYLIRQPAIDQNVGRRLGSGDLQAIEHLFRAGDEFFEQGPGIGIAIAPDQLPRQCFVVCLASSTVSSAMALGASSIRVCCTAQGSRPAPSRANSLASTSSAAGQAVLPRGPMNSARSQVHAAACRSCQERPRDPQMARASCCRRTGRRSPHHGVRPPTIGSPCQSRPMPIRRRR